MTLRIINRKFKLNFICYFDLCSCFMFVLHLRVTENIKFLLQIKKIYKRTQYFFSFFQTDGKGVFQCSLSGEYILAAKAFHLSQEELWQLSEKSIDYIFADDKTKKKLKSQWAEIKNSKFQKTIKSL